MTPDFFNAVFEWSAGFFIWLSVYKMYKDKMVRGVHWAPIGFFALWGYWNLYYYPSLDQWLSFVGGINVVVANTVWFGQMVYYIMRERRFRSAGQWGTKGEKELYRSLGNGTFRYLGKVDAAGHMLPKLKPGSSWGPPPPETDVKPVRRKVPSCPEHGTDVMGCEDSCPYRWKKKLSAFTVPPMSKAVPYIPCQHCNGIGCDEYGRSDHEPGCAYLKPLPLKPMPKVWAQCPDCGHLTGGHFDGCIHRVS